MSTMSTINILFIITCAIAAPFVYTLGAGLSFRAFKHIWDDEAEAFCWLWPFCLVGCCP